MKITREFAWKAIAIVVESQSKQVDKYGKYISKTVRDKVWLSTRNITTDWPSKNLDYKMLDLFQVIENKKIFVKLQLP